MNIQEAIDIIKESSFGWCILPDTTTNDVVKYILDQYEQEGGEAQRKRIGDKLGEDVIKTLKEYRAQVNAQANSILMSKCLKNN